MAREQPWKDEGLTKPEWVEREVAAAVNAGQAWELETVDFADPNRPATCLEIDFPIVIINEVAAIERGAGKPVYELSKWFARRRSSVFRAMLIAGATKAPEDPLESSRLIRNSYYGDHSSNRSFQSLRVADIFMGGGTTVVEGTRLGFEMLGNDLNPVAWFIVKTELSTASASDAHRMLDSIENAVKPALMPFFACDCPRGHSGTWTHRPSGKVMPDDFDALSLTREERFDYDYDGPELVYTFWAKHGPCQATGCGHRTPILSTPEIATKTLTVNAWRRTCKACAGVFDLEDDDPRMAPGVPLHVSDQEPPFSRAELNAIGKPSSAECPHCGHVEKVGQLPKPTKKKVLLTLLVHPKWIKGESNHDPSGRRYGGGVHHSVDETKRWNEQRASTCSLIEMRGPLPEVLEIDGETLHTGKRGGTVPGKSAFVCMQEHCGREQDILSAIKPTETTGPMAAYAIQGLCPQCKADGRPYRGRFFAPADSAAAINASLEEWDSLRQGDLADFYPHDPLPGGFMITSNNGGIPNHGFTHWWTMFNPRQLLGHAQILRAISSISEEPLRHLALAAFQQYIRNNCMFTIWNTQNDVLEPMFSNSNFHPKATTVESNPFCEMGRGNWASQRSSIEKTLEWNVNPWELVPNRPLTESRPQLKGAVSGKSSKVYPGDSVRSNADIRCCSSTSLEHIADKSIDLVITDPPFGGLLHYSELSDFFHVWMRLVLSSEYPELFGSGETPKALEAVANRYRNPDDPDAFYQRMLTSCWREGHRILKDGGTLAFTFHHSDDRPWVQVLESLFDAGFYLESTFPIRGDETKGEGSKPGTFGSQKIEYDIVHVCRKRTSDPTQISWAKLRRQVLRDVREIKELLEHHQEEGLPEADLQVIRRGKALEYFSRHYGQVYKNPDTPMSVLEALLGINQLLDEEAGGIKEPPPHNAEPFTRMLLRLFDGVCELPRDQMQKFLRGTGSAPSDFMTRGWVVEKRKIFHLVPPLDIAREWVGKQRRGMTSDYDQAMYLIGACFENSGINATETLNNANFRPHPALGAILTWFKTHGADSPTRNAAITASQLYKAWEAKNQPKAKELTLFDMLGEDD